MSRSASSTVACVLDAMANTRDRLAGQLAPNVEQLFPAGGPPMRQRQASVTCAVHASRITSGAPLAYATTPSGVWAKVVMHFAFGGEGDLVKAREFCVEVCLVAHRLWPQPPPARLRWGPR